MTLADPRFSERVNRIQSGKQWAPEGVLMPGQVLHLEAKKKLKLPVTQIVLCAVLGIGYYFQDPLRVGLVQVLTHDAVAPHLASLDEDGILVKFLSG